jgi:hypothetical protein
LIQPFQEKKILANYFDWLSSSRQQPAVRAASVRLISATFGLVASSTISSVIHRVAPTVVSVDFD